MAKPESDIVPLPPQNLDAEEYVLGAMMLSPHAVEACSEILTGRDFYRESHAKIFQACVDLYTIGDLVDAITVAHRLESLGELEAMGGKPRIHEIATLVPASSNAAHHARIVREHAIFRELTIAGERVQRLGWDRQIEGRAVPAGDLVEEAERLVFELSQVRRRGDFITAHQMMSETYNRLTELAAGGRDVIGVPTGFKDIDRVMSGLHPGNLIVLAARPSMGKTALALCVAANVLLRSDPPIPVALFTLEMSRWEVSQRLLTLEGLVESDRIQTPSRLDSDDWARVGKASARIADSPFFVEETAGATITEVRSKARRLKLRQPDLGLIIVDYIQLMSSGSKHFENRVQEVSQISRALKMLAGELEVPVLALSQLSRDVEKRHDRRPMLSDLRESGALEQDADVVLFVYRDEYYFPEDEANQGIAEIQIAKHRNGPTGMRKLSFVSRYARFSDLPPSGLGGGGPYS